MDMSIFNLAPHGNAVSMQEFVLENALSHSQISERIAKGGVILPAFPISTLGENQQEWLTNHFMMHQAEFQQIGLTGLPQLDQVDFDDEMQYYDWMEMHALVHNAVNQALGII